MVYGIIYKYTSPSGKSYIGQTIHEKNRKRNFRVSSLYSGQKFQNAIKKYGTDSFTYDVLYKEKYDTEEKAVADLNKKEQMYINIYDSYKNGYNMTLGGEGVRGHQLNDESKEAMITHLKEYYKTHDNPFKGKQHSLKTKLKLSKIASTRIGVHSGMFGKHISNRQKEILSKYASERIGNLNPFYNKKHDDNTKRRISEANSKPVIQIDPDNGNVLNEFSSTLEAGKYLGNARLNSEIVKVCRNYVSPSGRHYLTCKGFKWKYKE